MKSVLLAGQSNMAGRGYISETKPIINEKIWMLRNGRWQMMAEPIHFDRAVSGVGPAASFAEKWCIDNPKEQIGLIPCAEGGSSIDEWRIDGTLFRHAVSEAKFALENSELIAILWHQGENDSSAGKYKEYYKKLEIIVEEFRNTLGQVPFIIGGLGDYLGKTAFGAHCTEYELVNRELYKFATEKQECYFVTGSNLYSNPDGIHINAESQRRFGLRYYEAFNKKKHITAPLPDEFQQVEELLSREHTSSEKQYIALEKFTLGKISLEEVMATLK